MNNKKNILVIIMGTICLVLLIILAIFYFMFIKDNRILVNISEKFNKNKIIVDYNKPNENPIYYSEVKSEVERNNLIVYYIAGETGDNPYREENKFIYSLENNILTGEWTGSGLNNIFAGIIVDIVSQINGLNEGETYATFASDDIYQYKIKDGLEIVKNENLYKINIDVTKSLKLKDFSEDYIKYSDIEDNDFIVGDGSSSGFTGSSVLYHKSYDYETKYIKIAILEPYKTTDRTYKSILSFIEKIYGKTGLENFKTQFPKLENKKNGKIELIVNPKLTEKEEKMYAVSGSTEFEEYKITIIKIDYSEEMQEIERKENTYITVGKNISIKDYQKYQGNNISYNLLKEMLLLNADNVTMSSMSFSKYEISLSKDPHKVNLLYDGKEIMNKILDDDGIDENHTFNVNVSEKNNYIDITFSINN